MRKANLIQAHLEGAMLSGAYFEGADLRGTHLEGAMLHRVNLVEADLRNVFFDTATSLDDTTLSKGKDGCARLAGVHWGDVDLSVVNWKSVKVLGDEQRAHKPKTSDGEMVAIVVRGADTEALELGTVSCRLGSFYAL